MKILEGLKIWAEYGLDEFEKCEVFENVGGHLVSKRLRTLKTWGTGLKEFEEFEVLEDSGEGSGFEEFGEFGELGMDLV